MNLFNKLTKIFRNFPLNDEHLDEIIAIFEDFFKEYEEKNNIVVNSQPSTSFPNKEASLQMIELQEIEKEKIDKLIEEMRNNLKYNFFSVCFEKKENLELIQRLKGLLIKFQEKSKEQEQAILFLKQNKFSINEKTKINSNNNIESYLTFIASLSESIINNANLLQKINSDISENKQFFLKEISAIENKVNQKINNLYQENKELENKAKNIFTSIFKENIIVSFILSFWAFRMKKNTRYLIEKDEDSKNEPNENFTYFLKLIDDVFDNYLKKIIKNEEKIYDDIFKKFRDEKEKNQILQTKAKKEKTEIEEKKNAITTELTAQKLEIDNYQKEKNEIKNQFENLKKRIEKIKDNKTAYLRDAQLNKADNLKNEILIVVPEKYDKDVKKQYKNALKVLLNKLNDEVKEKEKKIRLLNNNILRNNTELIINVNSQKVEEKEIENLEEKLKTTEKEMLHKLQIIKEKWIKNLEKKQKDFIQFLKKNNKLETANFIKQLEDCWEKNKTEILLFNKDFDITNNLQVVKEKNQKLENELNEKFENLTGALHTEEKKIITNAKQSISIVDNFSQFVKTTEQQKSENVATQTEINTEEKIVKSATQTEINIKEKLEKQLAKSQQQNDKLSQNIADIKSENANLYNILSLIKKEHEDEIGGIKALNEDFRNNVMFFLMEDKRKKEEKCEILKNNLKKNFLKKNLLNSIKIELNGLEISLITLNELICLVKNQCFSSSTKREQQTDENWEEIDLTNFSNERNLPPEKEKNISNNNNTLY